MKNAGKNIKNCSKCGKSFECAHHNDCWCSEYVIPTDILRFLKKTYEDCLCPDCLAQYAENKGRNIDN